MPKHATHLLTWRAEAQAYEVQSSGTPEPLRDIPDSPAWIAWLDGVSSFSFHSKAGTLCTVRKETVQRGGAYWYAYRRTRGRMVKRYLARGADLTLARLEAVASALNAPVSPSRTGPAHEDAAEAGDKPEHPTASPPRAETRKGTPRTQTKMGDSAGVQPNAAREANPPMGTLQVPAARLLLTTKLHVPRATSRLVSRPHVLQRLQRGLKRPLTLIAAPAGFGKTAALRAWALDSQQPVAWVSLDASDNDPTQFWTYVLTALNMAHGGIADTALAMLNAPHPPPLTAALGTLLNAIATLPRDVALVLDDYHLITAPAIHEALATLLEHPPAQLHLYVATRSEPPLPLARLRVSDQVNVIHADDLRFRPDEIAAFLSDVMEVRLSSEDIMRLAERTDGWIAGLHLAGLSLQGHPDPTRFVATFGGSHRHVLTYLGEEVLAAQPEEVQTFLLQTAILERMCGTLCDAVTGRHDGRAMLARLEQANLFVVPLDDEGRWYRYYHLFADLLRHRLRQEDAKRVPELHRRAARWLEGEGWIVEAAEHLLAVPDAAGAARIIERAATGMLTRGEIAPLLSLINRLPDAVVTARPRLALSHATVLFFYGQLEMAERRLAAAERGLPAAATGAESVLPVADESDERRTLRGEIAGARTTLAMMRGDFVGAIAQAHTALAAASDDDASLRGRVCLPLGIAYMLSGQMRAANATLDEASRLSLAAGNLPPAIIALNMRALVLELQGQLQHAAALCRQAIHMTDTQDGASHGLVATLYGELGAVLYEWNDLVGARLALEKTIVLGQQWANGQDQVDGLVRLALVYQAQGQATAANEAIEQAEQVLEHLIQSNAVFPWVTAYAPAVGARLALRQGHLEQAERWTRERGLEVERYTPRSTAFLHEFEYLTFARVLVAKGKLDDAARLLERLLLAARAEERIGGEIEMRALEALVWQARGATEHALDALAQAVALAAPEGYVRVFVDEGVPMRGLLVRLRERQPRGSALRHYLDTLLAAFDRAPAPQSRGSELPTHVAAAPGLVEPLSEKEREVLRLLAQGRANQDIARHLVVAVSTVKTHVHHLYAKLQAADRLQAVTRARELGLLEELGA
jgi:LuxR family maltose regulon positive regulatory protein